MREKWLKRSATIYKCFDLFFDIVCVWELLEKIISHELFMIVNALMMMRCHGHHLVTVMIMWGAKIQMIRGTCRICEDSIGHGGYCCSCCCGGGR